MVPYGYTRTARPEDLSVGDSVLMLLCGLSIFATVVYVPEVLNIGSSDYIEAVTTVNKATFCLLWYFFFDRGYIVCKKANTAITTTFVPKYRF